MRKAPTFKNWIYFSLFQMALVFALAQTAYIASSAGEVENRDLWASEESYP